MGSFLSPHGSLQLSVSSFSGNPVPSSGLYRHPALMWHTGVHAGKTLTYIKIKKSLKKKKMRFLLLLYILCVLKHTYLNSLIY